MSTMTRPAPAPARSLLPARNVDWVLVGAVAGLLLLGTLLVWSATEPRDALTGGDPTAYLRKQLVNVGIGIVLLVTVAGTDHRWVRILAPLGYLASIVGLGLVLTMGSTVNGSRSWLMLGGLSIQPSELAKLAVVVGMALVCAERADWFKRGVRSLRGARHAGHCRPARDADPAPARPRDDARAVRHRLRGAGGLRGAAPVAGADARRAGSPQRWQRCRWGC